MARAWKRDWLLDAAVHFCSHGTAVKRNDVKREAGAYELDAICATR